MKDPFKAAYAVAILFLSEYEKEKVTTEIIQSTIEDALFKKKYPDIDYEELQAALDAYYDVFDYAATQLVDDTVKPWLYKTKIKYHFWSRYESFLRITKPSFPIPGLDTKTSQILDNCLNPKTEGTWDRRGMVVGNVQSGKTANYIGLINKAMDSGYKLIIVMAGIHNSLRSQTQDRIDEGVIGRKSVDLIQNKPTNKYGVGFYSSKGTRSVYSYTSTPYLVRETGKAMKHGDFDINKARELNVPIDGTDPTVLVIKKHKSILENLIVWLENSCNSKVDGYRKVKNIPLLVIDDEADNASVNAGDKNEPRTINRLIRTLLNLFTQSTFIGYTATPYANIFIPSDWKNELQTIVKGKTFQIGPDLFPKHFIVNIHPPSNYIGAAQIFGFENTITGEKKEPLDLIKIIDDQESCFPKKLNKKNKHKLPETISDFPASFKKAIQSFILTCAIRKHRGQINEHNSMLVHVALYVDWIDRVAFLVNDLIHDYKNQIKSGQGPLLSKLKNLFESDYNKTTEVVIDNLTYKDSKIKKAIWGEVKVYLKEVVTAIEVRAVHGRKKNNEYDNIKELNYDDYEEGLTIIAVGGNKLSRGITLQGLSISYYLRTTKMYDSLMQMGRWFGYRPGYADLCRLYTTETIRLWYRHITMATEDMRADFDEMCSLRMLPSQYPLKVMSHPGMLSITSAGKMQDYTKLRVGFSGRLEQTYSFSKSEIYLKTNLQAFDYLLSRMSDPIIKKNNNRINELLWRNVPPNYILDFITSYMTDQPLRTDTLAGYIRLQNKTNKLLNWDVALISNSNMKVKIRKKTGIVNTKDVKRKTIIINDKEFEIGLPVRNLMNIGNYVEVPGRKMSILDKRARMIGLDFKGVKNPPSEEEIKDERARKKQPLLVIYPLDPRIIDKKNIPIIGWGIAFPKFEKEEKYEYALRAKPDLTKNPHEDDDSNDDE